MAKKKKRKKPIRTNYVRGREVEYKCAAKLRQDGYRIIRASSSKGDFDIVAYNGKEIKFVQLKREKEQQGTYPSKRKEIREIDLPYHKIVSRELWIWTDFQGWLIQIIRQDGNDERTDLRRGKTVGRGNNKASTKS
jgi:Holliday junction resolvase